MSAESQGSLVRSWSAEFVSDDEEDDWMFQSQQYISDDGDSTSVGDMLQRYQTSITSDPPDYNSSYEDISIDSSMLESVIDNGEYPPVVYDDTTFDQQPRSPSKDTEESGAADVESEKFSLSSANEQDESSSLYEEEFEEETGEETAEEDIGEASSFSSYESSTESEITSSSSVSFADNQEPADAFHSADEHHVFVSQEEDRGDRPSSPHAQDSMEEYQVQDEGEFIYYEDNETEEEWIDDHDGHDAGHPNTPLYDNDEQGYGFDNEDPDHVVDTIPLFDGDRTRELPTQNSAEFHPVSATSANEELLDYPRKIDQDHPARNSSADYSDEMTLPIHDHQWEYTAVSKTSTSIQWHCCGRIMGHWVATTICFFLVGMFFFLGFLSGRTLGVKESTTPDDWRVRTRPPVAITRPTSSPVSMGPTPVVPHSFAPSAVALSSKPTIAPTQFYSVVERSILRATGQSMMESPAQTEALQWLVDTSEVVNFSSANHSLLQRFVLATMYFSAEKWAGCAKRSGNCTQSESSWTSESPECGWSGILCDSEQHVVQVNISNSDISSTLPSELVHLTSLKTFDASRNNFSGTLPDAWFQRQRRRLRNGNILLRNGTTNRTVLEALHLGYNQLTGTLPASIDQVWSRHLQILELNSNLLSGSLPGRLGNLKDLHMLDLSSNQFTGRVPVALFLRRSFDRVVRLKGNEGLNGDLNEYVCIPNATANLLEIELDCNAVKCDCCFNCAASFAPSSVPTNHQTSTPTAAQSFNVSTHPTMANASLGPLATPASSNSSTVAPAISPSLQQPSHSNYTNATNSAAAHKKNPLLQSSTLPISTNNTNTTIDPLPNASPTNSTNTTTDPLVNATIGPSATAPIVNTLRPTNGPSTIGPSATAPIVNTLRPTNGPSQNLGSTPSPSLGVKEPLVSSPVPASNGTSAPTSNIQVRPFRNETDD